MTTPPKATPPASDAGTSKKPRGPAVPTINLEKAIGLMRKVWEMEKRNAAPVAAIVTHWGYKPKSSGGFLAIASLKRFGLLDEQGSNEKRTLALSSLALNLLKNESTNPAEYLQLLKTAALSPRFHREMWTKYATELPSDQTIESYLVFDKHFSKDAAKTFIKEYKDTIAFAKLRDEDTVPEAESEGESGNQNEEEKPNAASQPPFRPAQRSQHKSPPLSANVRYLPIPLDIGEAPIPVGMSDGDFDLLLETLKLWKKKIVRPAYQPTNPANEMMFPRKAIWKNKDNDMPVVIADLAGEKDGVLYYRSSTGTGIPAHELVWVAEED